ncbi:MAG: RNA methyltransferase [Lachnospiraceae bacterium]|nr:RNA methyltransferase [Lachnospiraceae bacterium]
MPNIIEITDFNAPELDIYARLTENQLLNRHEPEKGIFIAESPKVVERALDAGYTPISLLLEKKHISGEAKHIVERCKDIPIYTAEFDVLTELTGFKLTRGVLAAMYRKALPSIESVCDNAKRIAVLDSVMNPTNVGAIFRSAAALGIDGILLTSGSSNPLYRRAIRVSMGTVFQIPWTFIDEINTDNTSVIDALKNLGFKTAAMALKDNSVNINDPNLLSEDKLAIILGTEGDGLSEATISSCDYTVCIPMFHQVDSLNVATASAIAFWEIGKSK